MQKYTGTHRLDTLKKDVQAMRPLKNLWFCRSSKRYETKRRSLTPKFWGMVVFSLYKVPCIAQFLISSIHWTLPRTPLRAAIIPVQYQEMLKKSGLGQSMSRRGNCWDNTPQESFFGHMKDHVDHRSCRSLQELKLEVDRYIRYYNNHRYQWGLKKMTPVQEKRLESAAGLKIIER